MNADSQLNTGDGPLGCNPFAYCLNNPVSYSDPYGKSVTVAICVITLVSAILACASPAGQQRAQSVIDSPNLYTITNWATMGFVDTAKEAVHPEKPLSLSHWLSAGSVAMSVLPALSYADDAIRSTIYSKSYSIKVTPDIGKINNLNTISSNRLEIGTIKGVRAPEGFPGIRYKTKAGPAYSIELHSSHNRHTPHLQVNKWLYHYKGYEGQPYRFRSWRYEFLKPWKGVYS